MASLSPTLKILLGHRSLSAEESRDAFAAVMAGEVSQAEIGALLALLALRVPTAEELTGAARVMRENVAKIPTQSDPESLVDTCGTGGAPKTFNVSTAAAIVAAGAGARVAKHGNRSRTGRGSAEVLKALGIDVDASRTVQAQCLDEVGICFCFAIHHHPATKNVMPARLALGVPTIFNLLGPLTNPAGARRQLLGVYDARFLIPVARALLELGATRAMVFHSDDGLDELSISAATHVVHATRAGLREERITPEDLGLTRAPREAVVARDLDHAVALIRDVVGGQERGPARDMTLMAAAGALLVSGRADSWLTGVQEAREAIDDGRAARVLERWIARSNAKE
jgi:anthranilate phosphoribosyltransferase